MRIILDTNALFDLAAMAELAESQDDIVLPAVAFAERARQIQRAGRPLADLWRVIERGRIQLESFGVDEALRRPLGPIDDPRWGRLARDAFIAGHVGPGDILWTKDVEDFVAVGVPREQIHGI